MTEMVVAMQEERIERERLAAVGEMVRRIVHNLRNPLAGIRSLAELTIADLPEGSGARGNQERIMSTVDRFESWLVRLLNVTKPLNLKVGDVAIEPWLTGVIEAHTPMAKAKEVRIRLDAEAAPEKAVFDAGLFEQALSALISNGVDAAPHGGQVRLTAAGEGKSWRITIEDTGEGVPPEAREQIFRPYFTTKPDGNGIGLAIVKQIVEQHGGQIVLESPNSSPQDAKIGSGARFLLTMPLIVQPEVARIGHGGSANGQDSHHRRRGEPPVLDRTSPDKGRP
jgi:signal transduction histidine kinase